MTQKIVVKIGSNVLTNADGMLDLPRMEQLVHQLSTLKQQGIEIILVSSGAVAAGRSIAQPIKKTEIVSARQFWASLGQVKLMSIYTDLFQKHNLLCSQVLVTKEDFRDRRHFLHMRNCIGTLVQNNVIPIINENDVISVSELMFTDNDELAGLMALMMEADKLIILSNIDGVFNGHPDEPTSAVIPTVDLLGADLTQYISTSKSNFGRGGMVTKYHMAKKVAASGITVYITNGKKEDILIQLIANDTSVLNTKFIAGKKKLDSNIKRWIAASNSFAKGEIVINEGAKEALFSSNAISLLPVGVVKISGHFKKDDIVRVVDIEGNTIGVGKMQYDAEKAQQKMGLKNQKPMIHYDYLFLNY